jgi:phospholipase D1/2
MPFEDEFWSKPQHSGAAKDLPTKVKGFITLLPIHWTSTQNNDLKFSHALLAENDTPSTSQAMG